MSERTLSVESLPDGVYLGFNIPGVSGKSVPHPWIEVVKNGKAATFEYGPSGTAVFGAGSSMQDMNQSYTDSYRNAGALFKLMPPAGMTPQDFIERALDGGKNLDRALKQGYTPYVPLVAADCDTGALALLHTLGGSALQFEQMTISAKAGGMLGHAFTDAGGLSASWTAGAVAETMLLTGMVWEKVGPAPGIPLAGLGSLDYKQLERDPHGRWVETQNATPTPRPGTAPEVGELRLQSPVLHHVQGVEMQTIHVERDGTISALPPGYSQSGRILLVEGDRIVQHIGRGESVSYSLKELEAHFADKDAFDAMMQPGHLVSIDTSRSGVIDARQQTPGQALHLLGNQPVAPSQSSSIELRLGR